MRPKPIQSAERLMNSFAVRTGIHGPADATRRYLWTDAYAVTTLIGLQRATSVQQYLDDAIKLADLVHEVLGRHRPSDARLRNARVGWLSGLPEDEGARRPTAGGLRIGKPLRERAADEPLDERLEWERDGQYFHYLTRWMRALAELALATGDASWSGHAVVLADTAARAFIHRPRAGGPRRIHWKMSLDLTRPLVASMGQHDALDGFATYARVRAVHRRLAPGGRGAGVTVDACATATTCATTCATTGATAGTSPSRSILADHIETLRAICAAPGASFATVDTLGIGGVLCAAHELSDLVAAGELDHAAAAPGGPGEEASALTPDLAQVVTLLHTLLADAHRSLDAFVAANELSRPLESRLAFRELGLALGLHAIPAMAAAVDRRPDRFGSVVHAAALRSRLAAMSRLTVLAGHIEETWELPAAQATPAWIDHRDIDSVMLAASLVAGAAESAAAAAASPVAHAGLPRAAPAANARG